LARRAPAALTRFLDLTIVLSLISCGTLDSQQQTASCGTPRFPYTAGWFGGDAAYSIPISAGKSVWLFGDTFVGDPDQRTRSGATLVHNSIAISECLPDGEWKIEYSWGRKDDGAPRAFLAAERSDRYWWLFDGFLHEDRLYIGLLEVEPSEPRGPLNLPFRYRGMKLARVENHRDAPENWEIDVLSLSENAKAIPGSAMVTHDGHLYLFTFLDLDAERFPRMLSRVSLTAFEQLPPRPADQLEYLARDGRWVAGLDPANGLILMQDNATEMTVRYHPEIDRWLALYSYPNWNDPVAQSHPTGTVTIRTAAQLEGPWSEPKSIYQIPELNEDYAAGYDPNTFCYAAKEHPEYAREGHLLVTYVCNLFTRDGENPLVALKRLGEKMYLYRPQAVSIPFPALELQ
jgi:hypothetical protein